MDRSPRGGIVVPRRLQEFANGTVARAVLPGVIVHVKASSGRLYRQFVEACQALGVDAVGRQSVLDNGRYSAWECVGPLERLERLVEHPAVSDWHLIIGVRVPLACGGSGTPSASAERRIKAGKREDCERAAERQAAHERGPRREVWSGSVRK